MTRRSPCSPSPAQPGRLAGSCYLFLGDARHAAPILEATARQLQSRSKAEAIVLGNLAPAYIGQSRVDEAAAALHKAIDCSPARRGGVGQHAAVSRLTPMPSIRSRTMRGAGT